MSLFDSSSIHFRYTGDGYFCIFQNESSGLVVDFLNSTIPELTSRLRRYKQAFRGGLDYGLVRFRQDILTQSAEFFEASGINAVRLEGAAAENEILCTETFRNLYSPIYPEEFAPSSTPVETKDRTIRAYRVTPVDFEALHRQLTNFCLTPIPELMRKTNVLIVDDELGPRETIQYLLQDYHQVTAVPRAQAALEILTPGKFDVIISDIRMPEMNGIQLLELIREIDPDVPVIMMTGYGALATAQAAISLGANEYLKKPFDNEVLLKSVSFHSQSSQLDRRKIRMLGIEPRSVVSVCSTIHELYTQLSKLPEIKGDPVKRMLRHKCKQICTDFVSSLTPRKNHQVACERAVAQCTCLTRVTRVIRLTPEFSLKTFLENYTEEQRAISENIDFSFNWNVPSSQLELSSLRAALALAVCELIDNAVAAIKGPGQISVSVTWLTTHRILCLTVKDNGPGIRDDIREAAFVEGVSTKGSSRGLGLSLVKEIIGYFDGEVRYSYDKGACFKLIVPLSGPS